MTRSVQGSHVQRRCVQALHRIEFFDRYDFYVQRGGKNAEFYRGFLTNTQMVDKARYSQTLSIAGDDDELVQEEATEDYERDHGKVPFWGYVTCGMVFSYEDPQFFSAGVSDPYSPFSYNFGLQ